METNDTAAQAAPANPFSPTSGARTPISLIPDKTLAWVGVEIRGMRQSKNTGGDYADIEFTVASGEYEGRKFWDRIADPYDTRNSEAWRQMAVANLTRAFEACEIFSPDRPESYNLFVGKTFIDICTALDRQVVAVRVKVEDGEKDGQADKNVVGEYLSPNPNSGGHKGFLTLINPSAVADQGRTNFLSTKSSTTGVATPTHNPAVPPTAAAQAEAPAQPAPAAAASTPAFQRPKTGTGPGGTPPWLKPKS